MQRNYCLPIIKSQAPEVQAIIQDNFGDYRYFEVWLDYIDDLHETFVQALVEQLGERLILLFRRQKLEPICLAIEQRQQLLKLLDGSPVLLDLDISQQPELDYIRQNGLRINLITSYHNYQATPDPLQLQKIIATMERHKPAIYKLATQCRNQEDALRLLQQLLQFKASGRPAIVVGMGEAGVITRVFGALWGNQLTFAPLSAKEQSAPGQLTRQQLETIFKELGQ